MIPRQWPCIQDAREGYVLAHLTASVRSKVAVAHYDRRVTLHDEIGRRYTAVLVDDPRRSLPPSVCRPRSLQGRLRRANAEEVAADYRVLGPLDVRADDVPLSLGGRKQAADYALSSA
jgi:hypothetical protein